MPPILRQEHSESLPEYVAHARTPSASLKEIGAFSPDGFHYVGDILSYSVEDAMVSGLKTMDETRFVSRSCHLRLTLMETHVGMLGNLTGGRMLWSCGLTGSSHGGSTSLVPSSSNFSSTVKPGGSVAISNKTPPGSLK